jgi:hypothetical protein
MMADGKKLIATNSEKNDNYWSEQIRLKRASGLSSAAYCREHGISYNKFYYWANKLTLAKPKFTQLLPVKVNSGEMVSHSIDTKCTLKLKGGHELKVHDQSVLPLLISLLR